jgi:hypothetical protein
LDKAIENAAKFDLPMALLISNGDHERGMSSNETLLKKS